MTSSANETQVGGGHYRAVDPAYQHWDFVVDTGLGYLEGCATKYISRHRLKNKEQDLDKALHYVQKLIECADDSRVRGPGVKAGNPFAVHRFVDSVAASQGDPEASWVHALAIWVTIGDLRKIEDGVLALKRLRYPEPSAEAGATYVAQD